ncbi:MAG: glycoside hydrolase family 13 protein [Clostridia bacterium]|nr:glycoside hydrolase family 13 protein [Clostridia bacterium]
MALRILNAQNDRANAVDCVSITYRNGKISGSRALAIGEEMLPVLKTRRSLAVLKATLLFARDGGEDMRVDGVWSGLDKGFDVYTFDLPIPSVAGLYFYGYELHTASGKWYMRAGGTVGYDKVYIGRMLIYDEKYASPTWLEGGIIYHIFVDRFNKGSKEVTVRDDAVILNDWENGVPEYAEHPGDFLANNTFFGGTLWGVAEKLDYLKSLGVTCIYLSPVFKAYSNHKYDTGDYMQVDEMFGGDEALKHLFDEAAKYGIGVILDGVFNHVGDDSLYFDKYGKYGGNGAYSGPSSPYYDWFNFKEFPDNYQSWWGIGNLPRVNRNASFRKLINGEGGVVDKYMSMGAAGFRLDVVDELESDFVTELCAAIKRHKNDAYIVGEVWEDASDKMAYGERKKYFQGAQLDSVMNYPLRSAIVEYVLHGSAKFLADTVDTLYRHYPLHKTSYMMNILGTHDTERILTIMGGDRGDGCSNAELADKHLDTLQRIVARHRLMTAVLLQMTMPGIPCIYYGDEVGMEGYRDPFNRRPYPWGREDKEIFEWYKTLTALRQKESVFKSTAFRVLKAKDGLFAFERGEDDERIVVCTNTGGDTARLELDGTYRSLLNGAIYSGFINVQPGMGEILKVSSF